MSAEGFTIINLGAKVGSSFKGAIRAIQKALQKIRRLKDKAFAFGGKLAKAAAVGATAFALLARHAIGFNLAMAEVSTLVDTGVVKMKPLTKEVLALSLELGKSPTEIAKGLYQTISAGAETAAQAMEILKISTKASVGGVAEVEDAVKLLTATINSYGDANLKATNVADVAFIAVEKGITTFGELAAKMSAVIPIAASLNIRFEEVFASVAAVTKLGTPTAQAVTEIKAAMASIIKPTAAMNKLFKDQGGIVAAVKDRSFGLAGVLKVIKAETGGSSEKIGQLTTSLEALNGLVKLTGGANKFFTETLTKMTTETGASEVAFNKMADSAGFKVNAALNAINVVATQLGEKALVKIADVIEQYGGPAQIVEDLKAKFDEWLPTIKLVVKEVKDSLPVMGQMWAAARLVWTVFKEGIGILTDFHVTVFGLAKTAIPLLVEGFKLVKRFTIGLLVTQFGSLADSILTVGNAIGLISDKKLEGFRNFLKDARDLDKLKDQAGVTGARAGQLFDTTVSSLGKFSDRSKLRGQRIKAADNQLGAANVEAAEAAFAARAAAQEALRGDKKLLEDTFKKAIKEQQTLRNQNMALSVRD